MRTLRISIVCGTLLMTLGIATHGMEMNEGEQYEDTKHDHQAWVAQANADYAEAKEWARQHAGASKSRHEADPVRDAQYQEIVARCNDLAGHAKARCVANTKHWFDKS